MLPPYPNNTLILTHTKDSRIRFQCRDSAVRNERPSRTLDIGLIGRPISSTFAHAKGINLPIKLLQLFNICKFLHNFYYFLLKSTKSSHRILMNINTIHIMPNLTILTIIAPFQSIKSIFYSLLHTVRFYTRPLFLLGRLP